MNHRIYKGKAVETLHLVYGGKIIKLGLVSHVLPPSKSGQSIVIYNLLKDVDPNLYCLITNRKCEEHNSQKNVNILSGKCFKVRSGYWISFSERFNQGFLLLLGLAMGLFDVVMSFFNIIFRGLMIARILKRENCRAVVACTADFANVPAAYLASLLSGSKYYAYIFDYYSYQWTQPFISSLAHFFEPILLKNADGVIVPNEHLKKELKRRYSIDSEVIHNPYNISSTDNKIEVPWPETQGEIKVVYTGAIYHAHYGAFRNLAMALAQLNQENINLHIFSARSPAQLKHEGISGRVVYHEQVEQHQAIEQQKHADILFLPLAFESLFPEIIRTSSPGKMGEYLASGRPILVHAPSDSFVSWYFKEHQCGVVVDANNTSKLAQAIQELIGDENLRKTIIRNAQICAQRDFSLESVRPKFLHLLGIDQQGV